MKKLFLVAAMFLNLAENAFSQGFDQWMILPEESDPFAESKEVGIGYLENFRNGVFITCNKNKKNLEIKSSYGI